MKDDPVEVAAQAHSDLNIFHAVMQILEGGCLYRRQSKEAAERIVRICKAEAAKRLADYDAARARVRTRAAGSPAHPKTEKEE